MSGTVEQCGTPDVIVGNSPVPPQGKSRAFVITWNNYTEEDFKAVEQLAVEQCSDYAFQREVGESGTPHIQGALYFKSPRTFISVSKLLPKCHIERAKNWAAAKNYCQKKDTSVGESVVKGKYTVKDPLEGRELRDYQKRILEIIEQEPDDRSIYWFWDATGNIGKTTLCKHICLNNKDAIYICGKAADMKYAVTERVGAGHPPRTVLVDLTRTTADFTGSLYQGLEEIKNGIFFNVKYESAMVMFNCPHVICFANWEPDTSKLSGDRWKVYNITGGAINDGTEPPSKSVL